MTSDEREAVEFVCGLKKLDELLHDVENGVEEFREYLGAGNDTRMVQIDSLLGDVFSLLGRVIEDAEKRIKVE